MPINPLQRPGAQLLGADKRQLFLIEFSGMVYSSFQTLTKLMDKHIVRQIDHGKGERFDALGKAGVMYHTPGSSLSAAGQQIKHDTFNIMVDALLISHIFVDDLESKMNHFDLKKEYADKIADALALAYDFQVGCNAILAARHAARVPDGFGGAIITNAAMQNDVDVLTKALFDAQVIMDEKDVPESERIAIMRPTYYSMLAQNLDLVNSLYRGTGSIAEGEVLKVAGFTLIKSNTLPNTNVTTTYEHKYDGDFSKTVAICMTKEAVGTVQLKGLTTETQWDWDHQAWFLAAKMALGHGILRPECAVEIAAA